VTLGFRRRLSGLSQADFLQLKSLNVILIVLNWFLIFLPTLMHDRRSDYFRCRSPVIKFSFRKYAYIFNSWNISLCFKMICFISAPKKNTFTEVIFFLWTLSTAQISVKCYVAEARLCFRSLVLHWKLEDGHSPNKKDYFV